MPDQLLGRVRFVSNWPLGNLRPAAYNPRQITDVAFERLRGSLATYGVVKPVILNGDCTLVAGHQRTRALKANGAGHVPALVLPVKASLQDEIRFNLFHNSLETNSSTVRLGAAGSRWEPASWQVVPAGQVHGDNGGGVVVREALGLMRTYGPWGSVVIDTGGRVVLNSDYAVACRIARLPVLAYVMPDDALRPFLAIADQDYGAYHYESLGVRPYNQLHCQMPRLRVEGRGAQRSSTYESLVLPGLQPGERLVDFGCGGGDYVRQLRSAGRHAVGYEPHPQVPGSHRIDLRRVVTELESLRRDLRGGLYDVVVLDSVLNSITSLQYEDWVLTTCNALCGAGGRLITGTRNLAAVQTKARGTKAVSHGARLLEFLDRDNFSATFRGGVWTLQRFHSTSTLQETLSRYFGTVRVYGPRELRQNEASVYAVCSDPLPLGPDRYRKALDVELNMPYPGGYRHGRHGPVRDRLLQLVADRDAGRV